MYAFLLFRGIINPKLTLLLKVGQINYQFSHLRLSTLTGPMPNTVNDFWRMIWEYKINTIVMLTRCIELSKVCYCNCEGLFSNCVYNIANNNIQIHYYDWMNVLINLYRGNVNNIGLIVWMKVWTFVRVSVSPSLPLSNWQSTLLGRWVYHV